MLKLLTSMKNKFEYSREGKRKKKKKNLLQNQSTIIDFDAT